MLDVLIVGPVTRDSVRIGSSPVRRVPGGVPVYAGPVLAALGFDVGIVTRAAPEDQDAVLGGLAAAGIKVHCRPAAVTTRFENDYAKPAGGARRQTVTATAPPVEPRDVARLSARIVHLGPLLEHDLTPDLMAAAVRAGGRVSLDAQGLVRRLEGRRVRIGPPPHGLWPLSAAAIVKANLAEAQALTGLTDPIAAARALARLGPAEVVVTCGARGAVVVAGQRVLRIPPCKPAAVVDRTGCGDTFIAGYLGARLCGHDAGAAARLGAALAALKLERHGPLRAQHRAREAVADLVG